MPLMLTIAGPLCVRSTKASKERPSTTARSKHRHPASAERTLENLLQGLAPSLRPGVLMKVGTPPEATVALSKLAPE